MIPSKILIIHASRGRPERGMNAAKDMVDAMTSGIPYSYAFSFDNDDETRPQYLAQINSNEQQWVSGLNSGAAEAQNRAAGLIINDINYRDEDLIMIHADDIKSPKGWDTSIVNFIQENVKSPIYLIHIPNIRNSNNCAIIPIMSVGLYRRMGFVFYPEYISMYSDNDLYETASRLNAVYSLNLDFVHEHFTYGYCPKDATYERTNRGDSYAIGHRVFHERKARNFDIS